MVFMLFSFLLFYSRGVGASTAIEYGLIAAGISLTIIAVVFAFGGEVLALFDYILDALGGILARL